MSKQPRSALGVVLDALGSLKLSVVLLVIIGLLTWFGTLAQVRYGLYQVQKDYFESWFVFCELPVSVWGHPMMESPLKIPLPGAYPVMILLAINLLIGGVARLRVSWRNFGVLIAHLGILMLLAAGFVKLHYSASGYLSLFEPSQDGMAAGDRVLESGHYVSFTDYELALLEEDGDHIIERVVPEATIARASGDRSVTLPVSGLPFQVIVSHWADNAMAAPKGPMFEVDVPVVDGVFLRELEVAAEREHNVPGCYVTVVEDNGRRTEAIVTDSPNWRLREPYVKYRVPFTFEVQGKRYGLDLRRVIRQLPFSVSLREFRKTDHPGTMAAADFRSFVTVRDGAAEQDAQIFMNNPLRKEGFVLFQTNWGPQDTRTAPFYSIFEVAQNPSDQWPKIASLIIGIGMLIHFLIKIVRFLFSSTREALS